MRQDADPISTSQGQAEGRVAAQDALADSLVADGASHEGSLLPAEGPSREVLGPSWLSPLLMFLSVAVLMGTLIRRHKIVKRRAEESAGASRGARAGDVPRDRPAWSGGSAHDMTTLMADFEELAERLAAQLDNKAERLEQLLAEADRVMRDMDGRLVASVTADGREQGAAAPRAHAGRQDFGREPRPTGTDAETPPSHRRVHALADSGLSALDIARETGQPVGQIELILNLRR